VAVPVLTGERAFCPGLARDLELLGGQARAPLGVGLGELLSGCG